MAASGSAVDWARRAAPVSGDPRHDVLAPPPSGLCRFGTHRQRSSRCGAGSAQFALRVGCSVPSRCQKRSTSRRPAPMRATAAHRPVRTKGGERRARRVCGPTGCSSSDADFSAAARARSADLAPDSRGARSVFAGIDPDTLRLVRPLRAHMGGVPRDPVPDQHRSRRGSPGQTPIGAQTAQPGRTRDVVRSSGTSSGRGRGRGRERER